MHYTEARICKTRQQLQELELKIGKRDYRAHGLNGLDWPQDQFKTTPVLLKKVVNEFTRTRNEDRNQALDDFIETHDNILSQVEAKTESVAYTTLLQNFGTTIEEGDKDDDALKISAKITAGGFVNSKSCLGMTLGLLEKVRRVENNYKRTNVSVVKGFSGTYIQEAGVYLSNYQKVKSNKVRRSETRVLETGYQCTLAAGRRTLAPRSQHPVCVPPQRCGCSMHSESAVV